MQGKRADRRGVRAGGDKGTVRDGFGERGGGASQVVDVGFRSGGRVETGGGRWRRAARRNGKWAGTGGKRADRRGAQAGGDEGAFRDGSILRDGYQVLRTTYITT